MVNEPNPTGPEEDSKVADHLAEAHRRLSLLRQQLDSHPDLEIAIERLEMALSILTTKTGGML
jgi:hypothetical protein